MKKLVLLAALLMSSAAHAESCGPDSCQQQILDLQLQINELTKMLGQVVEQFGDQLVENKEAIAQLKIYLQAREVEKKLGVPLVPEGKGVSDLKPGTLSPKKVPTERIRQQ
jgi:hypothetical protein